jgi:hypothetical protein
VLVQRLFQAGDLVGILQRSIFQVGDLEDILDA